MIPTRPRTAFFITGVIIATVAMGACRSDAGDPEPDNGITDSPVELADQLAAMPDEDAERAAIDAVEAALDADDPARAAELAIAAIEIIDLSRSGTERLAGIFERLLDPDTALAIRRDRYAATVDSDDRDEQLEAVLALERSVGVLAERFDDHVERWDVEGHRTREGLATLVRAAVESGEVSAIERAFFLVGRQMSSYRDAGLGDELMDAVRTFTLPSNEALWTAVDGRFVVPIFEVLVDARDAAGILRMHPTYTETVAGGILTGHGSVAEQMAEQTGEITLLPPSDARCTAVVDGEVLGPTPQTTTVAPGSHEIGCSEHPTRYRMVIVNPQEQLRLAAN